MTGQNLVDAVASRLGMSAASTSTVPSTSQILEWVNTAIKRVVRKYGENIPQLLACTASVTSFSNCAKVVSVYDITTGLNATELPLSKIYSVTQSSDRNDKFHWAYITSESPDTAPDGTDTSIVIQPTPADSYLIFYVWMPGDIAVGDSTIIPDQYIPEVIETALAYGLISEGRDQLAAALLGSSVAGGSK